MEERELEDWEKKYLAEKRQLENWRGRRLRACRAADDLYEIIQNFGVENEPSILPPDRGLPTVSNPIKAELQNTVANLLRMILLHNDGSVSSQRLQRF